MDHIKNSLESKRLQKAMQPAADNLVTLAAGRCGRRCAECAVNASCNDVSWRLLSRVVPILFCLVLPGMAEADWESDWALKEGYSLSVDVEGLEFPSAIAFVPEPGPAPSDPLYFVTELRGAVKVVTNDRTVHTFANGFFELTPPEELPSLEGEMGLAGIALDAAHGYVFVSFIYQDSAGILRNNIVRFEAEPGTFSLQPRGQRSYTEIFARDVSRVAHQIGPMVVHDDTLYVSVGDGGHWFYGPRLDTTLGKILRMSLDGEPLPDNPFYDPTRPNAIDGYIWAKGLRNVFGLARVGDRLFAAENGNEADRFMEVVAGRDYLWDNTDWSIGTNGLVVFAPSVGPVQLAWAPPDWAAFPPTAREQFYLVLGGGETPGPGDKGAKAIVTLNYDFVDDRMQARPHYFARYIGAGRQLPVSVATGPDGLYLAALYPVRGNGGAVLKISSRPGYRHPNILGEDERGGLLMVDKGCYGCHGRRTVDVNVGPPLDPESLVPRIVTMLADDDYRRSQRAIDELDTAPHADYRAARAEIRTLSDAAAARKWIKYRLLEPAFDRRVSGMPKLGLTEIEATKIADFLVAQNTGRVTSGGARARLRAVLARLWPEVGYAEVVKSFVAGGVVAALLIGLLGLWLGRRRGSG